MVLTFCGRQGANLDQAGEIVCFVERGLSGAIKGWLRRGDLWGARQRQESKSGIKAEAEACSSLREGTVVQRIKVSIVMRTLMATKDEKLTPWGQLRSLWLTKGEKSDLRLAIGGPWVECRFLFAIIKYMNQK